MRFNQAGRWRRVFDVNDLVLNVLGGGLGVALVPVMVRHQKNDPQR
ncbi:VanZ family protein [Lacticaseibacillus jixianensis]|uniref:VanZ family protein n=1 Tax=Lacticaseibacillus jixianensis TaxID=2486012 RepID=A0ABW4B9A3_9LACO|nr:VanZ family protein [Lacticaseibacillus jixianensis]